MIKGNIEDICIADTAHNMFMRELTYTYVPLPASWCYKPPEELMSDSTGPKADVYSWASVVYEVSAVNDLIIYYKLTLCRCFAARSLIMAITTLAVS
jgi:hypothetical protein